MPVPLLLIWAPCWGWIIAANVLLGINQGLTWSTTVIMKIDLVGPARRGLAMGLNEAAGYRAVAVTALATGWLAASYGLRPAPFFLGIAFAALGLGLSTVFVRETHDHARHEARTHVATDGEHHGGPHRPAGVRAHQLQGEGPVRGQPGRAGQQPQRRARLGLCTRSSSPPAAWPWPASASSPPSTRRCGASGSCVTGALSDRSAANG